MNLVKLIWVIAIHSIIHGAIGAFFISTSEYVNKKPELIYTLVVLNIILILFGVGVFCVVLWRQPFCAKFFGALSILFALIYLIFTLLYFLKYLPFYANSVLDKLFIRTDVICWVGPEYLMTIWHVIIFLLLLFSLFWFIYGILLCKYAYQACCIPCPPEPCKPKVKKPPKCLPVCLPKTCPPPCPPCPPPCIPTCPPIPPPPPCPPPKCPATCPPPPPPPPPPSPSPKKPPKFVFKINKGISK